MQKVLDKLPKCEIILDDEFESQPSQCPNKAVGFCSICNKDICYYHVCRHKEDLK